MLLILTLTVSWAAAPYAASTPDVAVGQQDACCCCDGIEAEMAMDSCCEVPAEGEPSDCSKSCGGADCRCVSATVLVIFAPVVATLDVASSVSTRERIENERVASSTIHNIFHPPRV